MVQFRSILHTVFDYSAGFFVFIMFFFFFSLGWAGSRSECSKFLSFLYKKNWFDHLVNCVCIMCGELSYCILWTELNVAEMPLLIMPVYVFCVGRSVYVQGRLTYTNGYS
uniref:Uncharacterized protein n=2 Tax=Aegilops tauschii subsp. strangulata TaxID=200361 RepID=A0A453HCQ0_AEGTS